MQQAVLILKYRIPIQDNSWIDLQCTEAVHGNESEAV